MIFEAHFSNERDRQLNRNNEDNYRNVSYPKMSHSGSEMSSPSQCMDVQVKNVNHMIF